MKYWLQGHHAVLHNACPIYGVPLNPINYGGFTPFEEQWLREHARGLDDTTPIKVPELSESHWAPIAHEVRSSSFEVDAHGHAVGWGLVAGLNASKTNSTDPDILHFDMAFYFGRFAEKTHNLPLEGYRPSVQINRVVYPLEKIPESGGRVWKARDLPINRKDETGIYFGFTLEDKSFNNLFVTADGAENDSTYGGERGRLYVHVKTKNPDGTGESYLGMRTPPRWTSAHSVPEQILRVLNDPGNTFGN